MPRPASDTPEYDQKAENESDPKQKSLGSVFQAIHHSAYQHQRNGVTCGYVNDIHLRLRSQRRISYAAQNVIAMINPFSMIYLHPINASIGVLTDKFKV